MSRWTYPLAVDARVDKLELGEFCLERCDPVGAVGALDVRVSEEAHDGLLCVDLPLPDLRRDNTMRRGIDEPR